MTSTRQPLTVEDLHSTFVPVPYRRKFGLCQPTFDSGTKKWGITGMSGVHPQVSAEDVEGTGYELSPDNHDVRDYYVLIHSESPNSPGFSGMIIGDIRDQGRQSLEYTAWREEYVKNWQQTESTPKDKRIDVRLTFFEPYPGNKYQGTAWFGFATLDDQNFIWDLPQNVCKSWQENLRYERSSRGVSLPKHRDFLLARAGFEVLDFPLTLADGKERLVTGGRLDLLVYNKLLEGGRSHRDELIPWQGTMTLDVSYHDHIFECVKGRRNISELHMQSQYFDYRCREISPGLLSRSLTMGYQAQEGMAHSSSETASWYFNPLSDDTFVGPQDFHRSDDNVVLWPDSCHHLEFAVLSHKAIAEARAIQRKRDAEKKKAEKEAEDAKKDADDPKKRNKGYSEAEQRAERIENESSALRTLHNQKLTDASWLFFHKGLKPDKYQSLDGVVYTIVADTTIKLYQGTIVDGAVCSDVTIIADSNDIGLKGSRRFIRGRLQHGGHLGHNFAPYSVNSVFNNYNEVWDSLNSKVSPPSEHITEIEEPFSKEDVSKDQKPQAENVSNFHEAGASEEHSPDGAYVPDRQIPSEQQNGSQMEIEPAEVYLPESPTLSEEEGLVGTKLPSVFRIDPNLESLFYKEEGKTFLGTGYVLYSLDTTE